MLIRSSADQYPDEGTLMPRTLIAGLTVLVCALFGSPLLAAGGIDGTDVRVWMAIPFAGILLSIAICPLVAPHWWHHNFGWVSAFWAVLAAIILFFTGGFGFGDVLYDYGHIILLDYVPFIILLLGLFTVAGGIRIKGKLRGSPVLNTLILLIGTVLASWMGTTGAAMLLIRPLLRANDWRKRKTHIVVFFIFLVCNIGGSLTPLGDPPLFLGFLRGVDFTWTFNLWPETGFLTVALLAIFFAFDKVMLSKEEHKTPPAVAGENGEEEEKFGFEGLINLPLLAALIGLILLSSTLSKGAFWDDEKADKYQPALAAADGVLDPDKPGEKKSLGMTDFLRQALPLMDEKKYAEARDLYQNATAKALEVIEADPHKHDHEPAAAGPSAPTAAAKEAGDEPPRDRFEFDRERLEAMKLDADKLMPFAGGLDDRRKALDAIVSGGDNAPDPAQLKKLMLIDFQRSVTWTNQIRAHRSHDAVMGIHIGGLTLPYSNIIRDLGILALAIISWFITSRASRERNGFTWFPIQEVAKLFIGIFICIVPALKILQAGVDGDLAGIINAVTTDNGEAINMAYFWLTGSLSAFLDNAPTYLVFFDAAGGNAQYLMTTGYGTLLAISMGAVFMGAMTYIGNAPNFMVKAIAEEGGVKMPSFFGYMIWSVVFLVPLFYIVTIIAEF